MCVFVGIYVPLEFACSQGFGACMHVCGWLDASMHVGSCMHVGACICVGIVAPRDSVWWNHPAGGLGVV